MKLTGTWTISVTHQSRILVMEKVLMLFELWFLLVTLSRIIHSSLKEELINYGFADLSIFQILIMKMNEERLSLQDKQLTVFVANDKIWDLREN
jgi:hypothetical protein